MKRFLLLSVICCMTCIACAQERKYSTFYQQRASLFEVLPVTSKDIVFLGNSITNGAEWAELFDNPHVKNRGISGDITMGVYDRLDAILSGKPKKIFLLIGINDVNRGVSPDSIVKNIALIVDKVKKDSPRTKLYLQSVLPVTDHYNMFKGHTEKGPIIPDINKGLQELAKQKNLTYVDLYSNFVDQATGKMNIEYTNDGLHLLGKGYLKWVEVVKPYVDEK